MILWRARNPWMRVLRSQRFPPDTGGRAITGPRSDDRFLISLQPACRHAALPSGGSLPFVTFLSVLSRWTSPTVGEDEHVIGHAVPLGVMAF